MVMPPAVLPPEPVVMFTLPDAPPSVVAWAVERDKLPDAWSALVLAPVAMEMLPPCPASELPPCTVTDPPWLAKEASNRQQMV